MKELIQFCIKPRLDKIEGVKHQQKFKIIFMLLLLDVIISFVTLFPADYIIKSFNIVKDGSSLLSESIPFFKTNYGIILKIILLTPLFEELTVRLFLKHSKTNILLMLISNTGLVCFTFFQEIQIGFITFITISFLLVALSYLKKVDELFIKSQDIWVKYFPFVFYFSVFLFAFYHAIHYSANSILGYLSIVLLVLPKAVSGCFIGYIRVKFGFAWGVLLHVLMNTVSTFFIISSLF